MDILENILEESVGRGERFKKVKVCTFNTMVLVRKGQEILIQTVEPPIPHRLRTDWYPHTLMSECHHHISFNMNPSFSGPVIQEKISLP